MVLKGSSAVSWVGISSLCLADIAQRLHLHTVLLDCHQRAGWPWNPLLLWCLESYPLVFLRYRYQLLSAITMIGIFLRTKYGRAGLFASTSVLSWVASARF